jgi:hypothetical protein
MKNKKAISGIVATVFMIALVIAIAGIVWVVVNNLVSEELEEAGTCLEVLGEITINPQYTCYNSSSEELRFSIGRSDVAIETIVVSISGEGTTNSYEISSTPENVNGLRFYNGTQEIYIPDENEGFTYILSSDEGLGRPDTIRIFPVIKGRQCDASDTISEISDCLLLQS